MADSHSSEATALAVELARLERAEQALSRLRRRLHEQLDRGYPTPSTAARERQVSAERRALHAQIDALEARLSALMREPAA
ncbi:MAG TPA: hypothetical protein VE982_01835 [Gaiellaceae bacterium]|nr:hypothetical protein [Gaiellaceae bacterium]